MYLCDAMTGDGRLQFGCGCNYHHTHLFIWRYTFGFGCVVLLVWSYQCVLLYCMWYWLRKSVWLWLLLLMLCEYNLRMLLFCIPEIVLVRPSTKYFQDLNCCGKFISYYNFYFYVSTFYITSLVLLHSRIFWYYFFTVNSLFLVSNY